MIRAGQWLFASCSASEYGQVVRVGKDTNGIDVLDIAIVDADDIVWTDASIGDKDSDPMAFGVNPLTEAVLPEGVHVILRDVQYRQRDEGHVECHTPGSGCFRCTKFFIIHDRPWVYVYDGHPPEEKGRLYGEAFRRLEKVTDAIASVPPRRP